MEVLHTVSLDKRKAADLLVIPFWKEKKKPKPAAELDKLLAEVQSPLDADDFKGAEGESVFLYVSGQPEKRIVLLGLGEEGKVSVEKLRRAYSAIVKACHSKKIKKLNVLLPKVSSLKEEEVVKGVIEGVFLKNYIFEKLRSKSDDKPTLIETLSLIGGSKSTLEQAKKFEAIADAVYHARDLVNGNADDVTPQFLGETAKDLAKKYKTIKTTVFDKKRIVKEKMGLLLAVNRGSIREPAFIIMEYKGNPKSKDTTVVVGKGITYDTGGLNMKPTGSMETMKCDMGGAAAVIGTMQAAAALKLKVNLVGIIPSTENSVSATSYKPGDVYESYAGKTVEIGNTDAEGRLVLADALAYAVKHFKPTRIIDFATLTGAIDVALGPEASGLFSNDDNLAEDLNRAGKETFERVWRMPLFEEYHEFLKSDIADMRNIGGRSGGSITAAAFLEKFVDNTPWAHIDIASTAYLNDGRRYLPKHGTGVGVRLMTEFLENLK